jgi:hypothetical protein
MESVFYSLFLIVGAGVFLIVGAVTTLGLLVLAFYWAHCGLCLARDRVAMARGNRQARKHAAMLAERGRRDAAWGITEEGC